MKSGSRAMIPCAVIPLLVVLLNPVNGQGLIDGFWDFAQSAGVTPGKDPGLPPDTEAFPPDSGAFPPDTGAFPPDTGPFPSDTGAFPPDTGAFPSDTVAIPPAVGADGSAASQTGDKSKANPGGNVLPIVGGRNVNAGFKSETSIKKDGVSSIPGNGANVVGPRHDILSSSVGAVDIMNQEGIDGSKPVVNSVGKMDKTVGQNKNVDKVSGLGHGTLVDIGLGAIFGSGGNTRKDPSTSIGMVNIVPIDHIEPGAGPTVPEIVPTHSDSAVGTDRNFDVGPSFGGSILGPGQNIGMVGDFVPMPGPGSLFGPGNSPGQIPVGALPANPTNVEILPVDRNPDSGLLNPAMAQNFLNDLSGQSTVGEPGPDKKPPAVPEEWIQLYPAGRRPPRVKPAIAQADAVPVDPPVSETEQQMAEISSQSFGKHRNLYVQLRNQRIKERKQRRKERKQRKGRKGQAPGQQKKQQKFAGMGPRKASLSIPSKKGKKTRLVLRHPTSGRGKGRSKRQARRCAKAMQRQGRCTLGGQGGQRARQNKRWNRNQQRGGRQGNWRGNRGSQANGMLDGQLGLQQGVTGLGPIQQISGGTMLGSPAFPQTIGQAADAHQGGIFPSGIVDVGLPTVAESILGPESIPLAEGDMGTIVGKPDITQGGEEKFEEGGGKWRKRQMGKIVGKRRNGRMGRKGGKVNKAWKRKNGAQNIVGGRNVRMGKAAELTPIELSGQAQLEPPLGSHTMVLTPGSVPMLESHGVPLAMSSAGQTHSDGNLSPGIVDPNVPIVAESLAGNEGIPLAEGDMGIMLGNQGMKQGGKGKWRQGRKGRVNKAWKRGKARKAKKAWKRKNGALDGVGGKPLKKGKAAKMIPIDLSGQAQPEPPPGSQMMVLTPGSDPVAVAEEHIEVIPGLGTLVMVK